MNVAEVSIQVGALTLSVGQTDCLLHLASPTAAYRLHPPVFEIDGRLCQQFAWQSHTHTAALRAGGQEHSLSYRSLDLPGVELRVIVRLYRSPLIRFRYELHAEHPHTLTTTQPLNRLSYGTLTNLTGLAAIAELQLSHFDPLAHAYRPHLAQHPAQALDAGQTFIGPLLLTSQGQHQVCLAYEHGCDAPQSFLTFELGVDKDSLTLRPSRANCYNGQPLHTGRPWSSVWFQMGFAPGTSEDWWPLYRRFMLDEIAENNASRQPHLYYNTWNFQERNRYFHQRPYLESMTFARMEAEIEVAHRLGLDTFVIDTGWFQKTGDWEVNLSRFPDQLQHIRRMLTDYGMSLGLWFNPTVAALTSRVYQAHPDCEMTHDGQPTYRHEVWETEISAGMCLVSDYADVYIEQMVRLYETLGVTYFKWDGISQFGCDSPLHHHGTEANTPQERADYYAYEMGRQMIRIVEEVSRRCPSVIVDFDITEYGRFVGLGFLSVGKYFLVNNGPYFSNFDIPSTTQIVPNTINVFFHPGAARARVCRQGVQFDPFIPSILFLTHYLPDAPASSQLNSLASLMLGGNGIWGDLMALTSDDITHLAQHLGSYKQVAQAVNAAYPRTSGFIGSSPEIYEKLDPDSAAGIIVLMTAREGTVCYVTQPLDTTRLLDVVGADTWAILPDQRLKLTVALSHDEARIVYVFGQPL